MHTIGTASVDCPPIGEGGGNGAFREDDEPTPRFAEYLALFLNQFAATEDVKSVIHWNCGNGSDAEFFCFQHYLGVDDCPEAISSARRKFADKPQFKFENLDEGANEKADLAISVDRANRSLDDTNFEMRMRRLFRSARCFVVMSSREGGKKADSVNSRHLTGWVTEHAPSFALICRIPMPRPMDRTTEDAQVLDLLVYARLSALARLQQKLPWK